MGYIESMGVRLITVAETPAFEKEAKGVLTEDEVLELIDTLAADPERGDLIQGTGGLRKIRVGRAGMGKRGGARVVYYYHNQDMPVYLLTIFATGEKDDLKPAERRALTKVAAVLRKSLDR